MRDDGSFSRRTLSSPSTLPARPPSRWWTVPCPCFAAHSVTALSADRSWNPRRYASWGLIACKIFVV